MFYISSHHTVVLSNFRTKQFAAGKCDNKKHGKQLKKIALSHTNTISHKLSLTYTKYSFQTLKDKLHYINYKITQNEHILHLDSMHTLHKSIICYITIKM